MDEEIRALRRAVERTGRLRFVALVESSRAKHPPTPSSARVTLATRCGDPGYRNIMRSHCWAVPLWTLEDLADLERSAPPWFVYDLERRRTLGHPRDKDVEDWPSHELEEGWGDDEFVKDCTVDDLRKRFGV